jgi:hypothetical protein
MPMTLFLFPLGTAASTPISSGKHEPAAPTTALHWMAHVSRPSHCYLDGAKVDSSAPASMCLATKHKAPCKSPAHHVVQKVVINVDNKDNNASSDDRGDTTEPITEPMSDDYKVLRAMADTNIRVHSPSPFTFGWCPHLFPRP